MIMVPAVCRVDVITSELYKVTRFSKIFPPKYGRLLGAYAKNKPLFATAYNNMKIDKSKPCLVIFYAIPNESETKYLSVMPLVICNIANIYKSAAFVKEDDVVDLYLFTTPVPSLSNRGGYVPFFDVYDYIDFPFVLEELKSVFIEKSD